MSLSRLASASVFHYSLAVVLIVFVLILSSYPVLFLLDYLVHDDSVIFRKASLGELRLWVAEYYPLAPYVEWPFLKLMVDTSIGFSRLAMWLFYAGGTAVLLYIFYKRYLGFGSVLALFSSVGPFMYPSQYRIPAGMNISYSLPTMMLVSVVAVVGASICRSERLLVVKVVVLSAAVLVLGYYAPNAPFVLAAICLLSFFAYLSGFTRALLIALPVGIAATNSLVMGLLTPRRGSVPFEFEVFMQRLNEYSTKFMLPVSDQIAGTYIGWVAVSQLVMIVLLLGGVWALLLRDNYVFHSHTVNTSRRGYVVLCAAAATWICITIFPYVSIMVVAGELTARFFWIAGFGVIPLLGILVSSTFAVFSQRHARIIVSVSLVLVLISMTWSRTSYMSDKLEEWNPTTAGLRSGLEGHQFVTNTQLVFITEDAPEHAGIPIANVGTLWYLDDELRHIDFAHIYSPEVERSWYDPHAQTALDWYRPKLDGIAEGRPLQILRKLSDGSVEYDDFYLQVPAEEAEKWIVYKLNSDDGSRQAYADGIGKTSYAEFCRTLKENLPGVSIAFGRVEGCED